MKDSRSDPANSPRKKILSYLEDEFLGFLWLQIKQAGVLRSISVDLSHLCNLSCKGCYFFAEDMDQFKAPDQDQEFDNFIKREKERETNFITVLGGEPSLELVRLQKLYHHFQLMVVTNGLRPIPKEGFEDLPIAISVWGTQATDKVMRGSNKIDVFDRALQNYKNDRRVIWYYTISPGRANEIHEVVKTCIDNGNFVGFNYYGDLEAIGGDFDYRHGFSKVRAEIDRMIQLYPSRILFSSYLNHVMTTGMLYDQRWGYDVCGSITFDHEKNQERIRNGNPYNPHFRAYYPDLKTTRRCCVGEARDCATCFDVWAHMSWLMLNMELHLNTREEFTNWLTTMYLFYLVNRLVDFDAGIQFLPKLHQLMHS